MALVGVNTQPHNWWQKQNLDLLHAEWSELLTSHSWLNGWARQASLEQ